jgi:hypothetical protein
MTRRFDPSTVALAAEFEDPDRIVGALLYLMSQWSEGDDRDDLVFAIGQHLEWLAVHPGAAMDLRRTALKLRDRWLHRLAMGRPAHRDDPLQ